MITLEKIRHHHVSRTDAGYLFKAALVVFALLFSIPGFAQRPTAPLQEFPTEQQAQAHCAADTVVWLNLPTGIYHLQGERWYGRTKSGAFVCEREADQAGMRATRNGQ